MVAFKASAASMVRLAPHAAVGASGSVNRFVAQERVNPITIPSSRLILGPIISWTRQMIARRRLPSLSVVDAGCRACFLPCDAHGSPSSRSVPTVRTWPASATSATVTAVSLPQLRVTLPLIALVSVLVR